MAVEKQIVTDNYAIYQSDCMEVMHDMPKESIDFSVYSPAFMGLYHYSSSDRDLSNCDSTEDFFKHYSFVVEEIERITKPGRCTAVHCTDVPSGNSGSDHLYDFPGDIIRLHEKLGFEMIARHFIWKEPLTVRNRTMQKNLAHKTVVDDSIYCGVACADQLIIFRKKGDNAIPVAHPNGLTYYAGERKIPEELYKYKGYKGNQIENRFSHWIWRQYASSFWDDIRLDNVLPFRGGRTEDDEKHVHPLQLDVIQRAIVLRSNPGEKIFTPFMGVGSEVYGAVLNGRKGIGVELKASYFEQAKRNLEQIDYSIMDEKPSLFQNVYSGDMQEPILSEDMD
jgi:DNA modification methylase